MRLEVCHDSYEVLMSVRHTSYRLFAIRAGVFPSGPRKHYYSEKCESYSLNEHVLGCLEPQLEAQVMTRQPTGRGQLLSCFHVLASARSSGG
jgi:hypothetical protein